LCGKLHSAQFAWSTRDSVGGAKNNTVASGRTIQPVIEEMFYKDLQGNTTVCWVNPLDVAVMRTLSDTFRDTYKSRPIGGRDAYVRSPTERQLTYC
jgi:hypothetical protein